MYFNYYIDSIITQMRQMEDSNYRKSTAVAIKSLMEHHPEEVIERLLCQPLPLDKGSEECWKALGLSLDLGSRVRFNNIFCIIINCFKLSKSV